MHRIIVVVLAAAFRGLACEPGDVCWRVAEQFGISVAQLLKANPRIDAACGNLGVGRELSIPKLALEGC